MTGIGLLGAFLGGLLSLLSPCSALLLPSFFAYAFDRLGTLVARTAVFFAGLAAVLVPLGAGVAFVGALITQYRSVVTTVGGVLLIGFGALSILGKGFGSTAAARVSGRLRISSPASVFALGTVYGLAGFCSGPLLGSVLTVAAVGAAPAYGALLLAVYGLGMTVPLFALAMLWDRFRLGTRSWLRGRPLRIGPLHTHSTSLVSGLLFVSIGILFLVTDGTANLGGLAGVDSQFDLQVWVQRTVSGLSDVTVLLVAVLVALALLTWRLLRRRAAHESAVDAAARPEEP
ncbi:cytochrome c biogenesis CcdA family protein [Pseudonocardia hispaniensis]|uniref:Cytochrome c biogenesis CcdA family protein n=1 Tax=Pseudonocardia hispaniensis TaxID=904933 RepID=A0ABW1J6H4_9PSEU